MMTAEDKKLSNLIRKSSTVVGSIAYISSGDVKLFREKSNKKRKIFLISLSPPSLLLSSTPVIQIYCKANRFKERQRFSSLTRSAFRFTSRALLLSWKKSRNQIKNISVVKFNIQQKSAASRRGDGKVCGNLPRTLLYRGDCSDSECIW